MLARACDKTGPLPYPARLNTHVRQVLPPRLWRPALAALPDGDRVTFPRLHEAAGMTAGNRATHLRKLEDAGYVTVTKPYRRRTPVTYLALTRAGRRALEDYTAARGDLLMAPGRTGRGRRAGHNNGDGGGGNGAAAAGQPYPDTENPGETDKEIPR